MALPAEVASWRATLAEVGAAAEHALWSSARFDSQVAAATVALAERREELDRLRTRLEDAQVTIERLKSAGRLIMRAIELRRAFLG